MCEAYSFMEAISGHFEDGKKSGIVRVVCVEDPLNR